MFFSGIGVDVQSCASRIERRLLGFEMPVVSCYFSCNLPSPVTSRREIAGSHDPEKRLHIDHVPGCQRLAALLGQLLLQCLSKLQDPAVRGPRPRLARNTAGSGRGPWYLGEKALSVGLSNAYFASLGLPSFVDDSWRNFSNRRVRTRMHRGRGRRVTSAPMPIWSAVRQLPLEHASWYI